MLLSVEISYFVHNYDIMVVHVLEHLICEDGRVYFTHWLQIDELVVLALQSPGNKGRNEIKQFADVLSEMHTSLKVDLWFDSFDL